MELESTLLPILTAAFLCGLAVYLGSWSRAILAGRSQEKNHQLHVKNYSAALLELAVCRELNDGDLLLALRRITETAANKINCQRVGVWIFGDEENSITCLNLYDVGTRKHSAGVKLWAADYPQYFAAIKQNRVVAAEDALNDARTLEFRQTYLLPNGVQSMMDAPVRLDGRLVGIVCHEHVGPCRKWTLEEQNFAGSIADFVALALSRRERQKIEGELRRSREELEHAHKMEALGKLAGGVAHDFNNILTGVRSCADILDNFESPSATVREVVKNINVLADKAGELTKMLLSFAKHGKLELKRIDLHQVVLDTIPVLLRSLDSNIKLAQKLVAPEAAFMADATQVSQVLLNLVLNARDALRSREDWAGVVPRIEIETGVVSFDRPKRVHPKQRAQTYLILSVQDNGIGIKPSIMNRIFDPFFTTKAPGAGTGVGLSSVYGIVDNHGGFILVSSQPGQGARFECFFPMKNLAELVKEQGQSNPCQLLKNENLLTSNAGAGRKT